MLTEAKASVQPVSPPSTDATETLDTIYRIAKFEAITPVSLTVLLNHAHTKQKLITGGQWLLHELKVRLAKQVYDLDRAPYGLILMNSARKVRNWYLVSFEELHSFGSIHSHFDQQRFVSLLDKIYSRHGSTMMAMARAVQELKAELSKSLLLNVQDVELSGENYFDIHNALDRFFMNRIGIRTLIGHYLELNRGSDSKEFVGFVNTKMNPVSVVETAAEDAKYMCLKSYGVAPNIIFENTQSVQGVFPFIPNHLYYVMFELLKNALRATVDFNNASNKQLPPVEVIISDSSTNEDLAVCVSDQGGGIPRSHIKKIWSYMYTTAKPVVTLDFEYPDFDKDAPIAGFGIGLPLSRLYARYFGGDLKIAPIEGYGTNSHLYLQKKGKQEHLEECNLFSSG